MAKILQSPNYFFRTWMVFNSFTSVFRPSFFPEYLPTKKFLKARKIISTCLEEFSIFEKETKSRDLQSGRVVRRIVRMPMLQYVLRCDGIISLVVISYSFRYSSTCLGHDRNTSETRPPHMSGTQLGYARGHHVLTMPRA